MSEPYRPPLTRVDVESWAAPAVDPVAAAAAAVARGIDPAAPALGAPPGEVAGFVDWIPRATPGVLPLVPRLVTPWNPDSPARAILAPVRLAIRAPIVPAEVVPTLLECPGVGSVVLPVTRAPDALRRRSWNWPFRLGVADDALRDALERGRQGGPVPAELVEIVDVRDDPAAVDLLALRTDPAGAAAFLEAHGTIANGVVCLEASTLPWRIDDARLALVRALSSAVLTAIATTDEGMDAASAALLATVRFFSHAHPIDVALTAGFGRSILISAETDAIADVTLPGLIQTSADAVRSDLAALAGASGLLGAPEPLEGLPPDAVDELARLVTGVFDHESGEAFEAADLQTRLDTAIDAAATPRFLQATIGSDNVLHGGANAVDVFLGPPEEGALQGAAVPNSLLGFDDPAVDSARLTVVLAPLEPPGDPVRGELDVPRVGRSPNLRLVWQLPDRGLVQARLLVLHRNRVLQTARITGRVGEVAELDDRIVLWEQTGRLDERTPFDRTFVLNHDARGESRVVSHADGATTIQALEELGPPTDRIRDHLLRATQLTSTGKRAEEAARKILIDVAIEGNDLYGILSDHLDRFRDARRIQIVTARSGRFLPLELVYDRPAPGLDAALCPNWTEGKECGDHCFRDADDISIVCPSVFWGMSRTIERQHASLAGPDGNAFVVSATPTRRRRTLTVTRALLAASQKVRDSDVVDTATALGGATRAITWDDWTTDLSAARTDFLVLMPHTDPKAGSLEISAQLLRTGQIEARHVTGGQDVTPVVVLFGCDTAGSKEDPAGYATRFLAKGAGVVFSTLTLLLGRHAAQMSQRLATLLKDPSRKAAPLGDLVTEFRRDAVRAGLISAIAVTAYGDADWRM
ncbi:hypothetical protein AAIB33_18065 [Microbacterium sp. AZCO]|uniref:hypothetical protein n=1 Tax=Microbacterium sp. AZCO TaxID=3142976 RepID=UPI0031F34B6D